jgi:molybdopterin synthase catalytic subunit
MKSRSFHRSLEAEMRTSLNDQPIDVSRLMREAASPECGGTVVFIGTVRNENDERAVVGLDYRAYAPMAEKELAAVVAEAEDGWPGVSIVCEHRIGSLSVGEVAVAIVATHPHRDAAFAASRYVIEALKRRVPIWKREQYADGTSAWVETGHAEVSR